MGKNDQLALTAAEIPANKYQRKNSQGLNLIFDGQLLDV